MIKQALILSAGLGSRMRELTKNMPKPMIEVAGRSLITRLIDQLIEYGIEKIVINVFYKADLLMEHVNAHPAYGVKVLFSEESELLETGGGIIKALHYLDEQAFFVVNADAMFVGKYNPFALLNSHWVNSMRALFLLTQIDKAIGYDGKGDFDLDKTGQLVHSQNSPYVFIGAHITRPETFKELSIEKIKLMDIYSKFLAGNIFQAMYGIIYSGQWLHIGTPEGVKEANDFMAALIKKI